jgi:hypothetical protein
MTIDITTRPDSYWLTGNVPSDKAWSWMKETATTVAALVTSEAVLTLGGKTTLAAANGAVPITHAIVEATSGAASAWTLADGTAGQILTVVIVTDGGAGTITPTTATGWATTVLTTVGETISLKFIDATVGWVVLGSIGITAVPVISQ